MSRGGRQGLPSGRPVLGSILVLLGVGWLLDVLGYRLRWQVVLAVILMAVGTALLLGARRGSHPGLVALGIVLTALLVLGATLRPLVILPVMGSTTVGERTERPVTTEDLGSRRRLGVGSLNLDLRELDLPEGTTEMAVSVGVGELMVRIPEGITVTVEADVGIGEVVVAERRRGGIGVTVTDEIPGDDRVLALSLRVGIGKVEVRG